MTTKPSVELWFEFGSVYSYLAVMRAEKEAEKFGVHVLWKPFVLGGVFKAIGHITNPMTDVKEKRDYTIRDMARQCSKYGLKWITPITLPRPGMLPLRIAMLGSDESWIGKFCRAVMEVNYGSSDDINDPDRLALILRSLELPAEILLENANQDETKLRLRRQTDTAREKGIFGAPTIISGPEMFWGNDRLDDALAYAAARAS